jgi:hypothetical protein
LSNEEMDRVLAGDDGIVPSSGFASSVMKALRRDAEAPPPIPFPWKRALPGLIVCLAAAVVLLFTGSAVDVQMDAGTGWVLAGLLVAALSAVASVRLA